MNHKVLQIVSCIVLSILNDRFAVPSCAVSFFNVNYSAIFSTLPMQFVDAACQWWLLGRHGSVSLCRVERENKMAATYMYSVPHEESRKIVFAHFASYLSN